MHLDMDQCNPIKTYWVIRTIAPTWSSNQKDIIRGASDLGIECTRKELSVWSKVEMLLEIERSDHIILREM